MTAVDVATRALDLLEEADALRAEALGLLEPLHRARGWKGCSDALSVICTGRSITPKAELPAAQARRREALQRIARELDAAGEKAAQR
jgi:hypothetical protein